MNLPDIEGLVQSLLVGGFSAAAAALAVQKKHSSNRLSMREDDGKAGLISRLEARAQEAEEEAQREREHRTRDAERIARMEAEIDHLRGEVRRERRMADGMRQMVNGVPDAVMRAIEEMRANTDMAPFDERPGAGEGQR